jgi:hypothetical protein
VLPFRCNDVEQSPPYLFLAEGIDETLAVVEQLSARAS